jgi:hypothetical protein
MPRSSARRASSSNVMIFDMWLLLMLDVPWARG